MKNTFCKKLFCVVFLCMALFIISGCSSQNEPVPSDFQSAEVILYDNSSMGNSWECKADPNLDVVSETGGYEDGVDGGGGQIVFTLTPTKDGTFTSKFTWRHLQESIEATAKYTIIVKDGKIVDEGFMYDGDYELPEMHRIIE